MSTFNRMRQILTFGVLTAALAGGVRAETPQAFNYQGRLAGYVDETVDLTVTFWDKGVGGTALFSETQTVGLENGVFALRVGAASGGVPDSALDADGIWLGLSIDGGPELAPRTRLLSVPFARKATSAEQIVEPDTFLPIVTVTPGGVVTVAGAVAISNEAGDGGTLELHNESGLTGVQILGAGLDTGGRITLWNGDATENVATIRMDADGDDSGQFYMYDASGQDAIRLHSDRFNAGPEFSMWMGPEDGARRETVQVVANSDGGNENTGGQLVMRHVADENDTAIQTVELRASSPALLEGYNSGGFFELCFSDGTPVYTVQAGSLGALFPIYQEIRAPHDPRRLRTTPTSLQMHNSSDELVLNLNGGDSFLAGSLEVAEEITTSAVNITGGADLAERFDVTAAEGTVEAGMVVCIDPANPGALRVSTAAYDTTVAGVISGAGGVNTGMLMSQTGTAADGDHAVALTGRVWVHCDAGAGAIVPGDLLTTADTPGHAMRAGDRERAQGALIGKAMTPLAAGERGLVLVLVNLQ